MPGTSTGVLLTAFGGPDSLESVGPFMARFMGREPAPAAIAAAQEKYRAIGGSSPLPGIADSIARALQRRLAERAYEVPVRVGMRYWEPGIDRALGELADAGAQTVVMVSLSAFESRVTCESYRQAAHEAADAIRILDVCEAPMLHLAPQYRDFFGHECSHALDAIGASRPLVVMTAHSLPEEDLQTDDPYVSGLRDVADAVAAIAGLAEGSDFAGDERLDGVSAFGALGAPVPWLMAYQSRGARGGTWLGPDLGEVIETAATTGYDGIVVVPIGFATDHMETLYDLDMVASARAADVGLTFLRTSVPNDHESFIEALMWAVQPLLDR